MSDLVQRLTRSANVFWGAETDNGAFLLEAAEAIAALTKERDEALALVAKQSDACVEHVKGLNEQNEVRLDAYKNQLATARNALGHLSNGAAIFGNDWTDEDELAVMPFNPEEEYGCDLLFTLKVGDFRAIGNDTNSRTIAPVIGGRDWADGASQMRERAADHVENSALGADKQEFCRMLNAMLENLGLSQNLVAGKLGISPQYLSDLKLNRRLPSVAVVDRICKWMGRGPQGSLNWHLCGAAAHGWRVTPAEIQRLTKERDEVQK